MSNLKRLRTEANLSQSKLSELSGVNVRLIQDYEQGQKPINHAKAITVFKLSEALGCTMDSLLEDVTYNFGQWISIGDWLLACSNCDEVIKDDDTGDYPKYCPNCGKKMSPNKITE